MDLSKYIGLNGLIHKRWIRWTYSHRLEYMDLFTLVELDGCIHIDWPSWTYPPTLD